MDKQEKPWNIDSWEELRVALTEMQPRSKLYKLIKDEMIKRGHWKNHSSWTPPELKGK